jgi:hypothetical protein
MKRTDQAEALRCSDLFAAVFPTGEARAVNVGTERKPCWVVEGPEPSAADRQWARAVALGAINQLSTRVQNLGRSPTANTSKDVALTGDGAEVRSDVTSECTRVDILSANIRRSDTP